MHWQVHAGFPFHLRGQYLGAVNFPPPRRRRAFSCLCLPGLLVAAGAMDVSAAGASTATVAITGGGLTARQPIGPRHRAAPDPTRGQHGRDRRARHGRRMVSVARRRRAGRLGRSEPDRDRRPVGMRARFGVHAPGQQHRLSAAGERERGTVVGGRGCTLQWTRSSDGRRLHHRAARCPWPAQPRLERLDATTRFRRDANADAGAGAGCKQHARTAVTAVLGPGDDDDRHLHDDAVGPAARPSPRA